MRKTLGGAVLLALCVFVATAALAGTLTPRGVAQPTLQTIFRIDTPADGSTVFGIVDVKGYVLDPRGVSRITLLIDGAPVHDADINVPRTDVQNRYVRFFGETFPYAPGFATSFLATNYTSGEHTLSVRVTYSNSDVEELGTRTVAVDNSLAQAPIGALDSPRDPNVSGGQDYVTSVYPVTGWVLDANGIRTTTAKDGTLLADIEVMVDGMVVGQALYPLPRPDVANAHPDVMGALSSGFQMNLDTTRFATGQHTIAVRAWNTVGLDRVVGSETVYFYNNYGSLGPFGRIDWPMSDGYLFATNCQYGFPPSGVEYSPGHFNNWISGWVVDQNNQSEFEGVKYVELYLDGALLKSTSVDCEYVDVYKQEVNCYGKERPDILKEYPQFGADAKNSGFFFAIDGDLLLADPNVISGGLGIHRGLHYLKVKAGTQDPWRPAVVIDQIPVMVTCNDLGDEPSFGDLEVPVTMQPMENTSLVKGWVIDLNGLVQLNFYVDGVLDGSLSKNVPGDKINLLRMDVEAKYPWLPYPMSRYNGFEYQLDTSKYVDGVHQLVIESSDLAGHSNYWVQRPVVFDNKN
jgi:hypothetical protein